AQPPAHAGTALNSRNAQSRARSAGAAGYCSWPRWDGRKPVPDVVQGIKRRSPRVPAHQRDQARTHPRETMNVMPFYDGQHGFYAGIDLHARRLHLCVLDAKGKVVRDVNIAATPDAFLAAIAPFRNDLVVGCECMFAWYWLADLCLAEKVPLVV